MELNRDNSDRHIQFCEEMFEIILCDSDFSYSSLFLFNGNINRHNCRYWNDLNPRIMKEKHTQYPGNIYVWAGTLPATLYTLECELVNFRT